MYQTLNPQKTSHSLWPALKYPLCFFYNDDSECYNETWLDLHFLVAHHVPNFPLSGFATRCLMGILYIVYPPNNRDLCWQDLLTLKSPTRFGEISLAILNDVSSINARSKLLTTFKLLKKFIFCLVVHTVPADGLAPKWCLVYAGAMMTKFVSCICTGLSYTILYYNTICSEKKDRIVLYGYIYIKWCRNYSVKLIKWC